jgi:transcriptional regulator with XRE-family HTH domain
MVAARQQLGLSQIEVAEKLGITQQTYAGWERRTTALRPEYITRLAGVLNIPVEHLLGQEAPVKRSGGPAGKARQVFEAVSQLPRHQQQRILGVVEDMLSAYRIGHKAA